MSSPKFPTKTYDTPTHPWKEDRIKAERELIKKYGLKNHTEVWKAKTFLGKNRQHARELLAKVGTPTPQVKKESDQLINHLTHMGILPMGSTLDDVLALDIDTVLNRRLQTLVYMKGFSSTPSQARQLICHGHIGLGSQKVTVPGYMVSKDEEQAIQYTTQSPLMELSHPARPKVEPALGRTAPAPREPQTAPAAPPAPPQAPPQPPAAPAPAAPAPAAPAAAPEQHPEGDHKRQAKKPQEPTEAS